MKSKRAEEAIERYRKKFTAGFVTKNEVETVKEYCRLFTEVVELAEQDAEEEIEDKCKGFVEILETLQEEHEQQIEALKKRAVEAFRESCPIKHPGLNDKGTLCDKINIIGFDCNCPVSDCKFLLNFLQKLSER